MRAFPFPDKIASREELIRDLLFHKIPQDCYEQIADNAWATGVKAATEILERYPNLTMEQIGKKEGLQIEYVSQDHISGNVRYFSEYYSAPQKIILYTASIQKWAKANRLSQKEAYELILSHEFYHHLECTRLGLTSKQYQVPTVTIGKMKWGKSGIRALSEIGAHGFSRTYYEQKRRMPKQAEKGDTPQLQNHAVNDIAFRGQKTAQKIYSINPILKFLTGG